MTLKYIYIRKKGCCSSSRLSYYADGDIYIYIYTYNNEYHVPGKYRNHDKHGDIDQLPTTSMVIGQTVKHAFKIVPSSSLIIPSQWAWAIQE